MGDATFRFSFATGSSGFTIFFLSQEDVYFSRKISELQIQYQRIAWRISMLQFVVVVCCFLSERFCWWHRFEAFLLETALLIIGISWVIICMQMQCEFFFRNFLRMLYLLLLLSANDFEYFTRVDWVFAFLMEVIMGNKKRIKGTWMFLLAGAVRSSLCFIKPGRCVPQYPWPTLRQHRGVLW